MKSQIIIKEKKINSLEKKILSQNSKNISLKSTTRKNSNNSNFSISYYNSGLSFEKSSFKKIKTCLKGIKKKENLEMYKKITNEKFSHISFNNDNNLEHNKINYKRNQTPIKKIQIYNKYGNLKDFLKNDKNKNNTRNIINDDIQILHFHSKNKSFSNINNIDKLKVNIHQRIFK